MSSDSKKPRLRYYTVLNSNGSISHALAPIREDENQIVWTAWCKTGKVLHILPVYCGTLTVCGARVYTKRGWWKTAWGIPENMKDRMCYRCMYSYARNISNDRSNPPWNMRKHVHQEPDVQ